jgi:hypothetical protein
MNIKMTDTQRVEIFEEWEEKKVKLTINQKIIQKKLIILKIKSLKHRLSL